uniref:C-type lectin domain-containing protein n=1 Tax=Periophthalmus magnuspinnatus TaxID=409849 RepID=A0A3B4BEL0_9GOBI
MFWGCHWATLTFNSLLLHCLCSVFGIIVMLKDTTTFHLQLEKQPQSMTFPPPCFTVCMVFFGCNLAFFLLQTRQHSLSQTQVLTMTGAILLFLLCVDFDGILGKNIYISLLKTWTQAQNYCRTHHTDLSFAYSEEDHERILNAGQGNKEGWIGLHRDSENASLWWSGEGLMTYQNWDLGEPSNYGGMENKVHIKDNKKWNDLQESRPEIRCVHIILTLLH